MQIITLEDRTGKKAYPCPIGDLSKGPEYLEDLLNLLLRKWKYSAGYPTADLWISIKEYGNQVTDKQPPTA